jgi:hypothetical protein
MTKKSTKLISKDLEQSPLYQLHVNLRTAEEVYKAALYGALHNETQLIQILGKTGLKSTDQILKGEKYKKAVVALNALAEDDKKLEIEFSQRDIKVLRSAIKMHLKVVKNIPQLAREQLLITYSTLVEGYVHDTIRNFFKAFPRSLKSNKTTLKDSQLVDAILEGNTLEKLIDNRIREIMYDSISGWINYLGEIGFRIKEEKDLKEMFLVRNVPIHNNKESGIELSKEIGGKRYQFGKKVNVTENDIRRFKTAIDKTVQTINTEYQKKVNKNKTNTNKKQTALKTQFIQNI